MPKLIPTPKAAASAPAAPNAPTVVTSPVVPNQPAAPSPATATPPPAEQPPAGTPPATAAPGQPPLPPPDDGRKDRMIRPGSVVVRVAGMQPVKHADGIASPGQTFKTTADHAAALGKLVTRAV